MATYEFACSQCDHVTEKITPIAERPAVVDCEKCGAPALRVVSAVPTTFRAADRKAFKRSGR